MNVENERAGASVLFRNRKIKLDTVRIAAPCPIKWDKMEGSRTIRHCSSCKQNVFNISEMTRKEAEAVLATNTESLCLRLYRRADGTLITKDCPLGIRLRDRVQFKIQTIVASFLAFIHAFPAFGQAPQNTSTPADKNKLQVEMYDGGMPRPIKVIRAKKSAPDAKDMPVPELEAFNAYAEAKRFQSLKDLKKAGDAYERAIAEFRNNSLCTFDPVFMNEVATSYAKLLRKQKDRKKALSIELEFRPKRTLK